MAKTFFAVSAAAFIVACAAGWAAIPHQPSPCRRGGNA